jgi:hypothetical protein
MRLSGEFGSVYATDVPPSGVTTGIFALKEGIGKEGISDDLCGKELKRRRKYP